MLISDTSHYEKRCPFCGTLVCGSIPCNLVCKCNAKYYFFDRVWLDRKTGKRVGDESDG